MKITYPQLLELNLAILLVSTSGPLGRYIDLPVPITIGLRALIASLIILAFCKWKQYNLKIKREHILTLVITGLAMAFHWITYFYSLKLSSVAIGMISLFTYPVITAFLEPLLLKVPFQRVQLFLGIAVFAGIFILVPEFDFSNQHFIAVLLGILSATFYSVRNILTKSLVATYNGSVLMFYQLVIITTLLSPFYWLIQSHQFVNQLPALIALAVLTTSIGHTLFIYSFKHFSTTSVSIMSSSQPIYGILIGMIALQEIPDSNAIIGGMIILSAVLLESYFSQKQSAIVDS
ncbi:EamA/RhaT family transporter [bacterium]|nr:MAG: EamA/RhaT family transporter [bacterium]